MGPPPSETDLCRVIISPRSDTQNWETYRNLWHFYDKSYHILGANHYQHHYQWINHYLPVILAMFHPLVYITPQPAAELPGRNSEQAGIWFDSQVDLEYSVATYPYWRKHDKTLNHPKPSKTIQNHQMCDRKRRGKETSTIDAAGKQRGRPTKPPGQVFPDWKLNIFQHENCVRSYQSDPEPHEK
jgi:hypothetical protein